MGMIFEIIASDASGATPIEYGLISSTITMMILAGVIHAGAKLTGASNTPRLSPSNSRRAPSCPPMF
jgi:Flp pilus assembly pilin Flp